MACLLCLCAVAARADDIDIYRRGVGAAQPWVHMLLDVRSPATEPVLCRFGVDCQPPFLSPQAHQFLAQGRTVGEPVTASGILLAVIAAVLDDPRFAGIRLSLTLPDQAVDTSAGGSDVIGNGNLPGRYTELGVSRELLLETLRAMALDPLDADRALNPAEALGAWKSYVAGDDTPFTDPEACPRLYGVLALPGPLGDEEAPDADFTQFLSLLHQPETDLLPSLHAAVRVSRTLVLSTRPQAELATSYARAGGGNVAYFLEQPREAEAALRALLVRGLEGDASLAPASVAIDVRETGSLLDRYYVSMFQAGFGAAWSGNVKKFRLLDPATREVSTTVPALVDVRGEPAVELLGPGRGRIAFDALSFWTDVASLPPGDGVTVPVGADGRLVERGGAGQKIDGFVDRAPAPSPVIGDTNAGGPAPARQVYVEPSAPGPFVPFNADDLTVERLRKDLDPGGVLNDAELLELVRWGRGQDVDGRGGDARSWLLGGVIHSRPLAVNYGATPGYSRDNPNVQLFFGSTDGLFHIVEDTDVAGRENGRERFAFYPRQLLNNLAGLRDGGAAGAAGIYGVDGAPVALRVDRNRDGTIEPAEGDEVYVYFGLRRGGRGYFALDASDPRSPPELAWRITPGAGFGELGLGFSTPLVGRVKFAESPSDVLIFAAGYHGGWSADGSSRIGKDLGYDDDVVGNAIYIVDARSGELVWKAVRGATGSASDRHYEHAELVDSIPSTVSALRTPEGIVHRLYVGDTGGAVWRVDLPPGQGPSHRRDHWSIRKLADLGADPGEAGGSEARDLRFFHPPEIVRSSDAAGAFDGILIQSGDRAHPLDTGAQNYLFYIKDREVSSGGGPAAGSSGGRQSGARYRFEDLPDQTGCVRGTETDAAGVSCRERPLGAGWKLRFLRPGEKGLSRPVVDGGRVLATTYTPPLEAACTPAEGQGHLYAVNLADATALAGGVRVRELGAGIPPGPVHLGDYILLPGGGVDLGDFYPGGDVGPGKLVPTGAPQRYRVFWREPATDPL